MTALVYMLGLLTGLIIGIHVQRRVRIELVVVEAEDDES